MQYSEFLYSICVIAVTGAMLTVLAYTVLRYRLLSKKQGFLVRQIEEYRTKEAAP